MINYIICATIAHLLLGSIFYAWFSESELYLDDHHPWFRYFAMTLAWPVTIPLLITNTLVRKYYVDTYNWKNGTSLLLTAKSLRELRAMVRGDRDKQSLGGKTFTVAVLSDRSER